MFEQLWQLFVDIVLWLPRVIYDVFADMIDYLLTNWLPTDALGIQSALNGWPGDVLYFMNIFELDYGLTVMFTALIARFLLRRIPGIG